MHKYDNSSKWLIQHHGDSILRLAGVQDIDSWKPLQAELVQNRRLPDGLIEARLYGQAESHLFILEISTYPEARLSAQIVDDAFLVHLDRKVLPEVVVLFLHPRGNARAANNALFQSPLGLTELRLSWKAVKLWTLPAEDLLAAGDVGLVPWVPLTRFEGRPEPIFRECRARIDRDAPPDEHENLLAVLQVLAGLRYNDPKLFHLFGGRKAMIESPVLQELKEEWTKEGKSEGKREATIKVLQARFGAAALALEPGINAVDDDRLDELLDSAATSRSLGAFRKKLSL
jgi:predicted transposase YdaD